MCSAVILSLLLPILFVFGLNNNDCPYPVQFPTADEYQVAEVSLIPVLTELRGFETPLTSRISLAFGTNQWDCLATYNDGVLSVRTQKLPILSSYIPSTLKTSNSRLLCYIYSFVPLLKYLTGSYSTQIADFYENVWGLRSLDEIIEMQNKVESCGDPNDIQNAQCLNNVASEYNYCGDIMGIIVSISTNNILMKDGFNDVGFKTPFGNCTANCRPYSDPIGFFDSRVDIFKNKNFNFKKKDFPGLQQSNKFKWVNLLEDDDKGFFYKQQHVTPHIGYTVDPITISNKEYKLLTEFSIYS